MCERAIKQNANESCNSCATVVQVLQDLFYVLLNVLFYLWSLLYWDMMRATNVLRIDWKKHSLERKRLYNSYRQKLEKSVEDRNLRQDSATPTSCNGSSDVIDHDSRDHSIRHMPFPVGGPLGPSLYLQLFSRYSAPTHVNEHTYSRTNQQTRRIAIPPSAGKI